MKGLRTEGMIAKIGNWKMENGKWKMNLTVDY